MPDDRLRSDDGQVAPEFRILAVQKYPGAGPNIKSGWHF